MVLYQDSPIPEIRALIIARLGFQDIHRYWRNLAFHREFRVSFYEGLLTYFLQATQKNQSTVCYFFTREVKSVEHGIRIASRNSLLIILQSDS